MRLYLLSGSGNLRIDGGIKWSWEVGNNPDVPVYVHPDIDFHWLNGECLLRNKVVNLIKVEPNGKVSDESGPCYFLAEHGHQADEMLYRAKQGVDR